jgi:hypothetical protein
MGYARYDTAAGLAGYAVTDTCHAFGCEAEINRGMAYLCGGTPGASDENGCGKWFCGDHHFGPPPSVECDGLCGPCVKAWEDANPYLVAIEEDEWQRAFSDRKDLVRRDIPGVEADHRPSARQPIRNGGSWSALMADIDELIQS